MIAPPATIVQGKPGSSAQGFLSNQSQLVNATTVSTPPIKISLMNSIIKSIDLDIILVI